MSENVAATSTAAAGDALKAESVVIGGAFRAVITRAGEVVWHCRHTHFTDHSAKACAARQIAQMDAGVDGSG